jgi:N-acetylmuramoyl-L-alanine amidase
MTPPLICVDAGHGGKDPGAVAGGHREADIALTHALAQGAALERLGCAVLYTRTTDRYLELSARARAANERRADLFVSVHLNASTSPDPHGYQIFHAAGSTPGRMLASTIYAAAAGVMGRSRWAGVFPDESPQCGGRRLYVLRATRMPAVLVELGFLTHPVEREALLDPARTADLARATASVIAAHLGVLT